MQDEVNEKIVSLCITGGKISARILKNAMLKALAKMEQETKRAQQQQIKGKKRMKLFITENRAWRS